MNLIELQRALGQLRLGGIAAVLETRLRQAQAEAMAPIDLISCLVSDELTRRCDRLLERRRKQAAFRDPHRTLDNFDFTFNPKMNRSLVFDLATCAFIGKREDALFLGPGGTGKSHLAQAIGQAAIQQGYRVLYRETHILLDELADAVADGSRKQFMESLATVPLLIIDDFGMRKLPLTAAEDLLEIVMRRYERASTLLTSNRPVDDWGKLLGDVAAVTAMLDRILHHGHVLKCGPKSWLNQIGGHHHGASGMTGRGPNQPAAARNPISPFPFPLRGKAGAGGFPPRRALPASKPRWHASMPRLPPQEGFQTAPLKSPLRDPPASPRPASKQKNPLPTSGSLR